MKHLILILLILPIVILFCSKQNDYKPLKSFSFKIPAVMNKRLSGKTVVTQEEVNFEFKILEENEDNISGLLKITSSKNSKWRYVTGRYISPDSLILCDSLAILDRYAMGAASDTTRLTGAVYNIKINGNTLDGRMSSVPTRIDSIEKRLLPSDNTPFNGKLSQEATLSEFERDAWDLFNEEKHLKEQFDSIQKIHELYAMEFNFVDDSVRQQMKTLAFEILKANVQFFEKWQHSPDSILVHNSFSDRMWTCFKLTQFHENELDELESFLEKVQPEGSRFHLEWTFQIINYRGGIMRYDYESRKNSEHPISPIEYKDIFNEFVAERRDLCLRINPSKIHPKEKLLYYYTYANKVVQYNPSYNYNLLVMLEQEEKSKSNDDDFLYHINRVKRVAKNYVTMNRLYDQPAPSFIANDMFGNTIDLNSYKGNVVYLDFWTTWCGACLGSIPNLKRLYDKYHKSGFEIIGIALDRADKVAKVCKEDKIKWPQIVPNEINGATLKNDFGVAGYPEGFLLNKDGVVVEIIHPNDDRLDFIIQQYLAE